MTSITEGQAMDYIAQLIRRQAALCKKTLGVTKKSDDTAQNGDSKSKTYKRSFKNKPALRKKPTAPYIIKVVDEGSDEDESEKKDVLEVEDEIEAEQEPVFNDVREQAVQSPDACKRSNKKKRELSLKRLRLAGPWENVAEFASVYNHLYGTDSNSQSKRKALEMLRIWTKRRADQCPAAVCATAEILNVQLKSEEGNYNEADMRQLFAHAYTRFFNFMSSTEQTQNQRSMYDTAQSLGLWQWVVDLRHICSHEINLPDLNVLRSSAKFCQEWLKSYFWDDQLKKMQDVDVDGAAGIKSGMRKTVFNNITDIFNIFDAALECYMKGASKIKTARRFLSAARFKILKTYFQSNQLNSLDESFAFICKDISISLRKHATIKDSTNLCLEATLNMKFLFKDLDVERLTGPELKKLINTTQSFFRILALHGVLEKLVIAFFVILEKSDEGTEETAIAAFWVELIIKSLKALHSCKIAHKERLEKTGRGYNLASLNTDKLSKRIRSFYSNADVDIEQILVLGESVTHPVGEICTNEFLLKRMQHLNNQSAPLVKRLLPLVFPPLSAQKITANSALINTYLGKVIENGNSQLENNSIIYTADDIRQLIEASQSQNKNLSFQSAEIFKTFDAVTCVDLSDIPLGSSVSF